MSSRLHDRMAPLTRPDTYSLTARPASFHGMGGHVAYHHTASEHMMGRDISDFLSREQPDGSEHPGLYDWLHSGHRSRRVHRPSHRFHDKGKLHGAHRLAQAHHPHRGSEEGHGRTSPEHQRKSDKVQMREVQDGSGALGLGTIARYIGRIFGSEDTGTNARRSANLCDDTALLRELIAESGLDPSTTIVCAD
ncbi:hypothetical protein WOLCODRAFT_156551 [Wolfiporia cocos MD-104 SS10]|uniref:Uncharacterized protein n=1 Tax=Wolfiporia cocos (strain MD-104) TaxID=742152 RepID=A0A2H3JIN5_WOLCO|nr:hypothetical protein WOLCODRAFT_156551 [Wolfiporia cocos MD-104 SS10]